ncbi:MAG: O-antigen ligase family protein [Rivularia sp. (in: Bacteria)]|nr:O-antigen ligase family protein [Rivularia sp. MS3]
MTQQIFSQIIRLLEKSFIVVGLTFFSGAFGVDSLGLVLPQSVVSLFRFSTWGISAFLVLLLWQNTLIKISQNLLLFILVAIAYFSFIWSQFPEVTYFNSRDILMTTCFGLYFATRFSLKEQVELIAFTLFIGAIGSILSVVALPSVGIHTDHHAGALKGLYGHKNHFGGMMILMWLTFFSLPKENLKIYKYFGMMFSVFLILLSTSKTSLVISLLLISIVFFYKNFRWKGKISVVLLDVGILILGCVSFFVFTYWVELLTGLGRDATLTGRTPIWGIMISRLMDRPFFGYGRGAFFAPKSSYAFEAGQAIRSGWIPPHGHNGFLDLAVDIGLIGLGLFIIIYLVNFTRALKQAYASHNPEDLFPLSFLLLLIMNNITESLLIYQSNIYWVLFLTTAFTLSQKEWIDEDEDEDEDIEENYIMHQRHSYFNHN